MLEGGPVPEQPQVLLMTRERAQVTRGLRV